MATNLLQGELEDEAKFCSKWARNNYNLAQLIFGLSVLASFVSAILVGTGAKDWTAVGLTELESRILLSALTALPALLLLVNNTLRFEERAKWCWRKCRRTERLLRELRDSAAPDAARISTDFSAMSEEMEMEWPAFGSTPSQPKKSGP